MKPLKITIENINSFRQPQTIDFERLSMGENMFCIYGDTGSGKSTIFECITFALFGKSRRGNISDMVNLLAKKGRIMFEFEAEFGGSRDRYVCDRVIYKKASGSKYILTRNNVAIAEGEEVSSKIEEILGMTKEQFTKVALLEQGKFDAFLKEKATERADLLAKLLNLNQYKKVEEVARRISNDLKIKVDKLDGEINVYKLQNISNETLLASKAELEIISKQVEEITATKLALQKELDQCNEHKSLSESITKQESAYASSCDAHLRKVSELANLVAVDIEQDTQIRKECERLKEGKPLIAAKMNERAVELAKWKTVEAKLKVAESNAEKNRQLLESATVYVQSALSDGDTCPICGGVYHMHGVGQHLDGSVQFESPRESDDISSLKWQLEEIKRRGKEIGRDIEKLEAEYAPSSKIADKITDLEKSISKNEESMNKQKSLASEVDALARVRDANRTALEQLGKSTYDKAKATELEGMINEVSDKHSAFVQSVGRVVQNIESLEKQLPELAAKERERAELTAELKGYDELHSMVKGRKFFEFVSSEYIDDIAVIASNVLQRLTGGLYSLKYSEKEFYIIDYLNGGGERKVASLSGGETFAASMSIAIAIMQQISAGKNVEFFFLDEGFGTLSEEAMELTLTALRELAKDVTVGVISHMGGIKEGISNSLHIQHATEDSGSIAIME